MTQNQINYAKHLEDKRHNAEMERQSAKQIDESIRHNTQTETLGFMTLDETKRHDLASESVQWFNATEQQRHYQVTEAETERHNKQDEEIGRAKNAATIEAARLSGEYRVIGGATSSLMGSGLGAAGAATLGAAGTATVLGRTKNGSGSQTFTTQKYSKPQPVTAGTAVLQSFDPAFSQSMGVAGALDFTLKKTDELGQYIRLGMAQGLSAYEATAQALERQARTN